jgi:hypothetical protein
LQTPTNGFHFITQTREKLMGRSLYSDASFGTQIFISQSNDTDFEAGISQTNLYLSFQFWTFSIMPYFTPTYEHAHCSKIGNESFSLGICSGQQSRAMGGVAKIMEMISAVISLYSTTLKKKNIFEAWWITSQ